MESLSSFEFPASEVGSNTAFPFCDEFFFQKQFAILTHQTTVHSFPLCQLLLLGPFKNAPFICDCGPVECCVFEGFLQLSLFFVAPVPTSVKCVAKIKFRISVYLQKHNTVYEINIKYKYIKRISKIIMFIFVLHSVQHF